jgi:hypothetical protein
MAGQAQTQRARIFRTPGDHPHSWAGRPFSSTVSVLHAGAFVRSIYRPDKSQITKTGCDHLLTRVVNDYDLEPYA